MHRRRNHNMSMHKLYAGIASAVVIIALVWGFAVVGSPMNERLRKFDERRVDDLRVINQELLSIVHERREWETDEVPTLEQPLPTSLDEVAAKAVYQKVNTNDPQTGEPYEYRITGESTYALCAQFSEERDQPYDVFWNHPSGQYCFSFDALKPEGFTEKTLKPTPVQ